MYLKKVFPSEVEDSLDTEYLQTIQDNRYFETALVNLPKFEIRSNVKLKRYVDQYGNGIDVRGRSR